MIKKITGFVFALLIAICTCIVALPISASFDVGDVLTITESAGGGVYYNGTGNAYYVSAMNATKSGDNKTYYAWCASYGEKTPDVGRNYTLYNSDNAGWVTHDGVEYQLFMSAPASGIYMYYDTGLNEYIDFHWAISCIKAAEALAGTAQLPFSWRMAVELAIRSQILDIDVAVGSSTLFGLDIRPYFKEDDCNTVAEFFERTKSIVSYAERNLVVWEPYVEEIMVEEVITENEYQGDYFILYECVLNKSECEIAAMDVYDGVEVTLDFNVLTVKIPVSKMPVGKQINWEVELKLDAGDNYNVLYGKPTNGGTDVQNIIVYDVSTTDLDLSINGSYITTEENASVTIQKTDTDNNSLNGMSFDLYQINDNGTLGTKISQTTNSNGFAKWQGQNLGYYFLVENNNEGYAPYKPEEWVITGSTSAEYVTIGELSGWKLYLGPGTTSATIKAVNKRQNGTVRVEKLDVDGNFMPGFSFTLYPVNADGSLGTGITQLSNNSGNIFFEELLYGEYFVVENYVGTGYIPYDPQNWYVISEQSEYTQIEGKLGWKVKLGEDTAYIQAINYMPTNTVTVYKTDTKGNPLQGIQFRLYGVNDEGTAFTSLKTGTTNVNGLIDYGEMTAGKYFLTEIMSGHGYTPRTPEKWVINGVAEKQYTTINGYNGWLLTIPPEAECMVYAVNGKQPTISLDKLDRDGNPLSGMKFSLYLWENNNLSFLQSYTTDADGHIDFGIFSPGYYFITEEQNAKWKPYNPDEWRVVCATSSEYITIGNHTGWLLYVDVGDDAEIKAVNDYTVSFTVNKVNIHNAPIEGAAFTLEVSYDNGHTYTVLTTKLTDENGEVSFTELDRYLYYRITETKAPAGCSLLKEPVYAGRISEEAMTVTVFNGIVFTLPMTGGSGMWSLYLAGALLALGTILLLTSKAAQNKKIQKGK